MPEFVVVLETTGPDGEPWEQVVSPRFKSEVEAAAWQNQNELPPSCTVKPCDHVGEGDDEIVNLARSDLLPRAYKRWQSGDALALLWALELCHLHQIPMPDWCGQLIRKAGDRIAGFEARSLDEAFELNAPIHRGVNLNRARQRQRLQTLAFVIVGRLQDEGKKHDEALALAAEEMGLHKEAKSYVRDLVRAARDEFDKPAPGDNNP